MLKMTVRPLAIKNSSMPNKTPFSVDMTISSSTTLALPHKVKVAYTPAIDRRTQPRRSPYGRVILQVVGRTVWAVSIFATSFQPQPVFSSSNFSLFFSSPNCEM